MKYSRYTSDGKTDLKSRFKLVEEVFVGNVLPVVWLAVFVGNVLNVSQINCFPSAGTVEPEWASEEWLQPIIKYRKDIGLTLSAVRKSIQWLGNKGKIKH